MNRRAFLKGMITIAASIPATLLGADALREEFVPVFAMHDEVIGHMGTATGRMVSWNHYTPPMQFMKLGRDIHTRLDFEGVDYTDTIIEEVSEFTRRQHDLVMSMDYAKLETELFGRLYASQSEGDIYDQLAREIGVSRQDAKEHAFLMMYGGSPCKVNFEVMKECEGKL